MNKLRVNVANCTYDVFVGSSILDNISGIGEVRKKKILKKYKTIDKMKEASISDLSLLMPRDVAISFVNYLKNID